MLFISVHRTINRSLEVLFVWKNLEKKRKKISDPEFNSSLHSLPPPPFFKMQINNCNPYYQCEIYTKNIYFFLSPMESLIDFLIMLSSGDLYKNLTAVNMCGR